MQTFEQLVSIARVSAHGEVVAVEGMTPKGITIDRMDLKRVCGALKENPATFFDTLACITAVDNGPAAGTLDVIYNLYSIPFNHHLAVKVVLRRDQAAIDSVERIWKTAGWHEREAYDMFGVTFHGHSDLRRILLPADWEGHPLRKDYKHQEYYRGVKVEY